MLDKPTLLKVAAQQTAVIHLYVLGREMPKYMHPAMEELAKTLAAQGIKPAGPMFTFHHRMPSEIFDFEVGFPVTEAVKASGRVVPGELPAGDVLRTTYHGPYEGLAEAWREFLEQVAATGREAAPTFWESYAAGPETGTDTSKWRTELNRPLVG